MSAAGEPAAEQAGEETLDAGGQRRGDCGFDLIEVVFVRGFAGDAEDERITRGGGGTVCWGMIDQELGQCVTA